MKSHTVNIDPDKACAKAADQSVSAPPALSAKGAALLALPFALVFTILIIFGFDLSWFWALPIYASTGALLIALFLFGSFLAERP